ncbi:ABC transporter family substrate-binding protein [Rhodococcus sp. MEB064]|uniref:ABC transporter family substrate-binding protein n=1 Tax=Rhodococcus sp. MEB064 TaxID=1587522 RepID=UPI0005ACFC54|nr:ABC transporter family substrate-binding protein [Rhodococcus sp. MEB064]KIQ10179.1 monoacyl phosphatidylinositol tetramannoside-binding protein [Rhodococcus sp. MEB064]
MSVARVGAALAAALLALSACTADPPPPIQSTETATTTPPAAPAATGNPVVVAIDDVGTGFNPHLLADQSPANTAVSTLVLPSPFRPAAVGTGIEWLPDASLLVSAEVTSQAPFTITYRLRNESQWSDGAPIAAEDFRYLWQQMIDQPGVVDPAGYDAITDVQSADGGKTVNVVMASPYPAWRELFENLLPSHLLKDSLGGFERGLRDNVSVSGGHFRIESIDRGRDEILLERNDRFWGSPATPDQILLRRGGSDAQLADSMRSGDAQIAEVRGGTATLAQLGAIPNVRTDTKFRSRALELTLNGRVPALADVNVRRGIMGLLDVDLLSTVASGTSTPADTVRAQILSPSQPGYVPTAPSAVPRDESLRLLADAGYTPVPLPPALAPTSAETTTPTTTPVPGASRTMTMVIGAPENDAIAVAVANTAADQLRDAGIDATVAPTDPEELYGTAMVSGAVDAIVGWSRVGVDPGTALASRFGCAAAQLEGTATSDDADPVSTGTLSGLCDPTLDPIIEQSTRGEMNPTDAVLAVQGQLWALNAVLPIAQDRSVVAVGPGVSGASLAGPIDLGVFGDADAWMRVSP